MSPGCTLLRETSFPTLKIFAVSLGISIPFYLNIYYKNPEQSNPVFGDVPPYVYLLPTNDLPVFIILVAS